MSLETQRLRLERLDTEHLGAVHVIYTDPMTWQHLPSGRFADRSRTETMIRRARLSWDSFGLGPWVLSHRDNPSELIGTAGCARLVLPACRSAYWNGSDCGSSGAVARPNAKSLIRTRPVESNE